jgi:hypothetical protein
MMLLPVRRLALGLLIALTLALPALAQRGGRRFNMEALANNAPKVKYDGRVVIVRLFYASYPGWSYDYPDMEQNLTLILKDVSALPMHPDSGSRVSPASSTASMRGTIPRSG